MAIERIAIITGVEAEAEAFCRDDPGRVEDMRGFSVRHLCVADKAVAITCCGVGKVNAAAAASLLVTRFDPHLLMIIGTAGRIGPATGPCFWISEAVQHDYGAQRAGGFAPYRAGSWPIGPADTRPFLAIAQPGDSLPETRIASGDAFIECPDHARALHDGLGADLVDMETAALAQVAERFGLPWAAIKATSDDANGDSVEDFTANLARAARLAAQAAKTTIERFT